MAPTKVFSHQHSARHTRWHCLKCRTRGNFLACLLVLAWQPSLSWCNKFTIDISSDNYSEIAPLKQIRNNLKGPSIQPGSRAFTDNRLQLVTEQTGWLFGLTSHYQYALTFTPDTAKLIHALNNQLSPVPSHHFKINLKANELFTYGLTLGYLFAATPTLTTHLQGSYLTANTTTKGHLWGELLTDNDSQLSGNLWGSYHYNHDILFKRPKNDKQGTGYSITTGLTWKIREDWQLKITAFDLVNDIHWHNHDYTTASATTNNISYDSQGFLDVKPNLQWIETKTSFSQKISPKWEFNLDYRLSSHSNIIAETVKLHDIFFYRLHYFQKAGSSWKIHTAYDFTSKAITLGASYKYFSISYYADNLQPRKTFSQGLKITLFSQDPL